MTTTDPRPILNRFRRSELPTNHAIAQALRDGATTLADLAAEHGVRVKSITKRLQIAGWDAEGNVIPPWVEIMHGRAICKRCGRERQVKPGDTPRDLCRDCRAVESDLARGVA